MSIRKYPLIHKALRPAITLALGTSLLIVPLSAYASDSISLTTKMAAGNPASSSPLIHPVQYEGSPLSVGENHLLSRKDIAQEWDDLDPDYLPDKAIEAVKALLTKQDFEDLFPYRLGSKEWFKVAEGKEYYKADQSDYFSYDNLISAVAEVSNIKIKISTRTGTSAQEIYRLDKEAKVETLVLRSDDFNSVANKIKPIDTVIVDCGTFLKEGFKKDRKRELAAFLANLSHETGGGWATAPGGPLKWDYSGMRISPGEPVPIWMLSSIQPAPNCSQEHQASVIMAAARSC
ncbi:glycoside hydrolase family 19 protein [Paenibacillus sp. D2_2]|uniref:glycoside hydrolase family 19 protein n=1 Tax=Paenibacillus sp. D2_2 TaxID=3073092 RepID=UPI0028165B50|nr:glycoside hydrolase family 19 protein [Paenibacillus sp. D2_2]WMT41843.1 glycoside hydrolase family 19 protein [Paenibacillus sp. D2_2]